ncbi:MAG: hypothetical protein KDM64_03145 [Verrucomicrobiae bacterium]|nr:hypothetical protein [Verrucomicrobiae bacterium]
MNSKPFLGIAAAIFAMVTTGLSPALAQQKQTLQDVYQNAVKQFDAGQFQEALTGFQTVLKYQPNFVYARSYAAKCVEAIKKGESGPKQTLEAKLSTLVVPNINSEGANLGMVFEFLTQKSEELSGGKVVANFIYKGTDDQKKNALVTLTLRNTPFLDVVRYVGQLTDTQFKYEEFAVVAAPVGSGPAAPSPANATQTTALESKFDQPSTPANPFPQTPPNDPFTKR